MPEPTRTQNQANSESIIRIEGKVDNILEKLSDAGVPTNCITHGSEIQQISRLLKEVCDRIDKVMVHIDESVSQVKCETSISTKDNDDKINKMEVRLRDLEQWKYKAIGIGAAIIIPFSVLITKVVEHFFK